MSFGFCLQSHMVHMFWVFMGKGSWGVAPWLTVLFLGECQSISPVLESTARKTILSVAAVGALSLSITSRVLRQAGK